MPIVTKSYSTDFGSNINEEQLQSEISNDGTMSSAVIISISRNDDDIDIEFTNSLSGAQSTQLDTLISSHTPLSIPKLKFQSMGNYGTLGTIQMSQTGNRPFIIPDVSDTAVALTASQNLQNKKLISSNTEIVDSSDNTKIFKFDTSSANTSTCLTLLGNQTGNRTITFPDTTDTLVTLGYSQTLLNKKLIDSSTTIIDDITSTKELDFQLSGANASTKTTLSFNQTANRTINFPDNNTTLIGTDTTDTLTNKTLTLPQINDTSSDHQYVFGVSELTANRTVTLPLLTSNDEFTFNSHTSTLTNKTIDADNNTITNIDNSEIKAGAAIDATKIADGSVTNTEFQYINTVTSNVQTQLDSKAASSHTHNASDINAGTFADARIAASNVTQHEGSITIGNLTGAPTGTVVGTTDTQTLTNKSFGDDVNINSTTQSIDGTTGSLIVDGGVGIAKNLNVIGNINNITPTEISYLDGVTSGIQTQLDSKAASSHTHNASDINAGTFADARIAASNVTQHEGSITIGNLSGAPSGSVVGTTDTQTLTNKTLTLPQINDTSSDHQYIFGVSELTADRTVTLPLLTGNDEFTFNSHASTLTNKTINADNNTITNIDNSEIKAGAAIDATKIADGSVTNTEFQYINTLTSNAQTQINGKASSSHTHNASDINAGTLADARIAASNVTQHEGSITIGNLTGAPTGTVVGTTDTQTLTNKSFGDDVNINSTTQSIDGTTGALIVDGGVGIAKNLNVIGNINNITPTEISYLDGVTSGIQTQLDSKASSSHTHNASDINAGTFADARIAASNVTQHEGSITIGNLTGAPSGTVVGTSDTQTLTNKTLTDSTTTFQDEGDNTKKMRFQLSGITTATTRTITIPDANFTIEQTGHSHDTSNITTGTFANARIAASNVTQHEGSITIGNLTGAPSGTVVGTTDTQTLTNKTLGDNLDANSNKIINLATPSADNDAANKAYVDDVVDGRDTKDSVRLATTVDLDSNGSISGSITYNNTAGTSGRGQITATLNVSDTFTIDGVNLGAAQNGTRILLKDQTTGAQNGIWTTTISGTSLTLDRATDFDEDSEVTSGAFTFIEEGTANSSNGFSLTTANPIIIGGASGTSLIFTQTSGAGQITAGNGLTKTGNTLDIGSSSTITVAADSISVNESNVVIGNLSGAPSGTVVGTTDTQTLTNKTLTDSTTTFQDEGDNTKKMQFQLSGITTATTRTITIPDANFTIEQTGHVHAASDINAGTFADARIAASNVTQHEGSITIGNLTGAPTGTVVGTSDTQTLTNKTLTLPQINDTSSDHQYIFGVSELTADRTVTLPLLTGNDEFTFNSHTSTLTNKTIDADNNTITNIDNSEIKAGAAIDATKIADGSVTNTEFQYINTLTSNAQTQINGKASSSHTHNASDINAGTFADARIAASNVTQHEGSITIGNLTGAPSGAVVGTTDTQTLTNKSFGDDVNINSTTQSIDGTTGALIVDGGVGIAKNLNIIGNINNITPTEISYLDGVTSGIQTQLDSKASSSHTHNTSDINTGTFADARIAASNVTQHEGSITIGNLTGAPTGTVVGTTDTQTLTNKTLTLPQINDTSSDHQYIFGVSELTADRTVTLPLLTGNDEFTFNSHTSTLTNKTIDADNNTITNIDNSEIKAGAAIDATKIADGSVTNTEFQYINTLTSNVQTQINGKASSSHTHNASDINAGTFADARIAASNVTQHEGSITIGNLTGAPSGAVVGTTDTQTLTNKSFGDDVNINSTTQSIDGTTGALIVDGGVGIAKNLNIIGNINNITPTEISYLDGVTSGIQTQLDSKASSSHTHNASDINAGTFADARIAASNVTQHEGSITIGNLTGAPSGAVVGTSDTQTLTNKTLTDSTTTFQDEGDNTKKMRFQLSGITTATTRTITIPDANFTIEQTGHSHDTSDITTGTFANARIAASNVTQHEGSITIGNLTGAPSGAVVGTTDTQTLTNKTLTLPQINDTSADHQYIFGVSELTADRTVTLPLLTGNDTFVFNAHTQTLTNKTLDSTTNTITCDNLHSATTTIDVSSATAPTSGQVLTATSGTAATWQTPSAGSLTYINVTATTTTTTTSGTYTQINSMTNTPASGTYLVTFSASGSHSSTSSNSNYAIYSAGSIVSVSERNFGWGGGSHTNDMSLSFHSQAIVTVNGSQAIEVRWHNGSSGTFTCNERSMILLKL